MDLMGKICSVYLLRQDQCLSCFQENLGYLIILKALEKVSPGAQARDGILIAVYYADFPMA
jgi:hypothetical protein